jgi:hypothetical protein
MAKKAKKEFVASIAKGNFRMDKQTKRMLAMFPLQSNVKLSAHEQAAANVSMTPLTAGGFKNMMIQSQLSDFDAKLTGMDDPLWKPKKEEVESEAGTSGSKPAVRKGKKHIKMRKDQIVAVEPNAN